MAKGTIKSGEAKKNPNQPSETASKKTNKKKGAALQINVAEEHAATYLSAYKSSDEAVSVVQEPYLGIVPAAMLPVYAPPVRKAIKIINKQKITCLITAVTSQTITADALIDRQNGLVQTRRFDKLPLVGVVDCTVGTLFNLTIVTRPGSREFLYTPGNADDSKYFEESLVDITSLRNDLKKDPNFQREPDTDDGHTF